MEWNATQTDYPRERTLAELFAEQAARTPEAVALVYLGGGARSTTAELDRRSSQLAHYLRALGVGPDVIVGVCLERSLDLVIGLLGILKAGGAYLPLDPDYPPERLAFMLADADAPVLLTRRRTRRSTGRPLGAGSRWFVWTGTQSRSVRNRTCSRQWGWTENLAYVIYTSGSTGGPKAVATTHRNVVRLIRNTNYIELTSSDVLLQLAPLAFDASTFELWGALLNGARLVLYRWALPGYRRITARPPRDRSHRAVADSGFVS